MRFAFLRALPVGLFAVFLMQATAAEQAPPPQTAPLKIALDIGHTRSAPGSISARGESELIFNDGFARALAAVLTGHLRFEVVLINADWEIASLEARVDAAVAAEADVFIAIHHDSVQNQYLKYWNYRGDRHHYSDEFRGYSVFYSDWGAEPERSADLATAIGSSLRSAGYVPTAHHAEAIPGENRPMMDPQAGVYRFNELRVLRSNPMPAMLLEVGVIVHRQEEVDVTDPEWRTQFISGVVEGLEVWSDQRSSNQ